MRSGNLLIDRSYWWMRTCGRAAISKAVSGFIASRPARERTSCSTCLERDRRAIIHKRDEDLSALDAACGSSNAASSLVSSPTIVRRSLGSS